MQLQYPVPAREDGSRISDFLRRRGVSLGLIRSAKKYDGCIRADGEAKHTDARVSAGQIVVFELPPERQTDVTAGDVPVEIVFEDSSSAVLLKPAGTLVHPPCPGADGTMANGWRRLMDSRGTVCPFRPVNRLDKDTSGLVLAAKDRYSASVLPGRYVKIYWAIAEGEITGGGCIDQPIGLRDGSSIVRCIRPDGQPSLTRYRSLGSAGGYTLLRVMPLTGRTHQIRAHFAGIGHPLAGDDLYGGSRMTIARQALHAGILSYVSPQSGIRITARAPFPQDMLSLLLRAGIPVPAVEAEMMSLNCNDSDLLSGADFTVHLSEKVL